jgi:hypothetical protein
MLSLAFAIDFIGFILLCLGLDDLGILDLIGMITIGGWMIFKSGKIRKPTGKSGALKKVFTGKYSKFLVTFGVEEIPYIGGLSFTWTAAVYFTLIMQDEQNQQIEQVAQVIKQINSSSGSPSGA